MIFDAETLTRARWMRDTLNSHGLWGTAERIDQGTNEKIAKLIGHHNDCCSFIGEPNYGGRVQAGVSEASLRRLEALTGPHGYAYYKMLLIQANKPVV
jgi:hypothetical protein